MQVEVGQQAARSLRPAASLSATGSPSALRPSSLAVPPLASPATSESASIPVGRPSACAGRPSACRAGSNRSSLSDPRRTPLDAPPADDCGSPPGHGAPSGPVGTHTSNPGSPPRRSAPESAGSPSAPPGPAPSGCPTVSAFRWLWVCRRVAPLGPIALRLQRFLDLVQKPHQALARGLDLFDRHAVHARRAFVAAHRVPGRLQRVPPIDPVIQRIEPELRLLLGLLVQLLSQLRKFLRQPRSRSVAGTASMAFRSSVVGSLPSGFSSSYRSTSRLRPLRSTVITRFLATMSLSDSRPAPLPGLCIPPRRWRSHPPPRRASQVPRLICPRALSPITPESPTTALPIASSPVSGFILKGGLATLSFTLSRGRIGSLALRLTSSPPEASPPGSLLLALGRLHVRWAIYMVSTFQLTRSARLSWRTLRKGASAEGAGGCMWELRRN